MKFNFTLEKQDGKLSCVETHVSEIPITPFGGDRKPWSWYMEAFGKFVGYPVNQLPPEPETNSDTIVCERQISIYYKYPARVHTYTFDPEGIHKEAKLLSR